MPYRGTLSRYNTPRSRAASTSMAAALKLAKQAMKLKAEYSKQKPAATRKPRTDKGKPRKPYTKKSTI